MPFPSLLSAREDSGPASCFASVLESPRYRHPSMWVLLIVELFWKGLSTTELLLIPSASQSRDLQGSAPPVPPLFPFISPRGNQQSPNLQKPPGTRCRNLRPENLRVILLSLPSPSFSLLEPYLRAVPKQQENNIFYSCPCAMSQKVNQPSLSPGCPALPASVTIQEHPCPPGEGSGTRPCCWQHPTRLYCDCSSVLPR